MAKYLLSYSYSKEALQALLKDGGSKRRAVAEALAESLGAKVEAFYYTFGEHDGIVILDAPDNITAAAFALIPSAAGAIHVKTTVLLTPEQIDAAVKKPAIF